MHSHSELDAGTDPLNPNSHPIAPTPEPESILLEVSILVGSIAIAAAIVIYGILQRSRQVVPSKAIPKKPSKSAPN